MRERPLITLASHRNVRPRPYNGWALDAAVMLDCACPSLLTASFYFRGSKRQAFFLALAALSWEDTNQLAERLGRSAPDVWSPGLDRLAVIARALIVLPPRQIVQAVLGVDVLPPGLMGSLMQLGDDPIGTTAASFKHLVDVFSTQTLARRARRAALVSAAA